MNSNQIELLGLLVTTLAAIVAYFSFRRWRDEVLGKDKYGVVRKFGMKFLELGECLHTARSYRSWTKPVSLPAMQFYVDRKTKKIEEADKILSELLFMSIELKLFRLDFRREIRYIQLLTHELRSANDFYRFALTNSEQSEQEKFLANFAGIIYSKNEGDDFGSKIDSIMESMTKKVTRAMRGL